MPNPTVTLIGNIGQDPESIKDIGLRLRVATKDGKKNPNTNKWEDGPTSWWTVKAWHSVADQCKNVLKKGQEVIVVGTMVEETWDDEKGNKRSSYEITAKSIAVTSFALNKDLVGATNSSSDNFWNAEGDTPF